MGTVLASQDRQVKLQTHAVLSLYCIAMEQEHIPPVCASVSPSGLQ